MIRGSQDNFSFSRAVAAGLLAATLAACGTPVPDNLEPRQSADERVADRYMVSSASPIATQAGLQVLRNGGNAVDAAVTVQAMLGFVEAPETGFGGGGFLLYRDGASGRLHSYDGRETAPATATAERFRLLGWPLPLWAAVAGGRSVGVPGLVAMLELAHSRHGRLPWAELLEPAITLAEEGIPMPERLRGQVDEDFTLRLFADTRRMFVAPAGEQSPRLRNPDYAETLRRLASDGAHAFYHGEIADDIVERAASRALWPSDLTTADFAAYRAQERIPICAPYRAWTICGAPPPSSGGVTVLQILGLLERFALDEMGPDSAQAVHLVAEASRLAFADRFHHIGDPDFVDVPVGGLLDPEYLATRAAMLDPLRTLHEALPGEPGERPIVPEAEPTVEEERGTSHFTIVDGAGNLVALTSSVEAPFGARMAARGMLLNNQLTDFTFDPLLEDGRPHPNAVAPGKRPRSSMAPIMVFDADGKVRLVIGSRGGARIIGYVVKALIGVLDWGLDVQEAIALPNFVHRGEVLELERGSTVARHREALEAMGHDVRLVRMTSGLHGVERIDGHWRGGADPRLDGIAKGE